MMRTAAPWTRDGGFAALDAMAAILLLCLAWAAIAPAAIGVIRKTRHRLEMQRSLYEERNARENRVWSLRAPDEE